MTPPITTVERNSEYSVWSNLRVSFATDLGTEMIRQNTSLGLWRRYAEEKKKQDDLGGQVDIMKKMGESTSNVLITLATIQVHHRTADIQSIVYMLLLDGLFSQMACDSSSQMKIRIERGSPMKTIQVWVIPPLKISISNTIP
jgi:hypothetical protein